MSETKGMEAVLGGALGRVPRRSPAVIAAVVLLGGICALGLGLLGYRLAAASGGFGIDRVEVEGAGDASAVREVVLRGSAGKSLLEVDPARLAREIAALPAVRRATVDRAFPHTLAITVVPERAIAAVATGSGRVAISTTGRVLGRARGPLPVIAAAPADLPGPGGVVLSASVLDELEVARAMRPMRPRAIGYTANGLVARTAAGTEIRFGDGADIAVKLKVARSVLRRADGAVRYVDVSVPAAPALRLGAPDPLTADAPPPAAPPVVAAAGTGPATPTEAIRGLFG